MNAYDKRVRELEAEGLTTSDAQGAADVEFARAASLDLLAALQGLPDLHCMADVLNPCWDGRPTDVMGKHWAGGLACKTCNARAAIAKATGND